MTPLSRIIVLAVVGLATTFDVVVHAQTPPPPQVIGYVTYGSSGGCAGRNELGTYFDKTLQWCADKCNVATTGDPENSPCISFEYSKAGVQADSGDCRLSTSCVLSLTVNDPNDGNYFFLKLSPERYPSAAPSAAPSAIPSAIPSSTPSLDPSSLPSVIPSSMPSEPPTVSPCSSNPCRNGGTCVVGAGGIGYECQCTDGFEGSTCGVYTGETTTLAEAETAASTAKSTLDAYMTAKTSYKLAEHNLEMAIAECNDATAAAEEAAALATKLTNAYNQAVSQLAAMQTAYTAAQTNNDTPADRTWREANALAAFNQAEAEKNTAEVAKTNAEGAKSVADTAKTSACDTAAANIAKISAEGAYTSARSNVDNEPLIPDINPATLDFVYEDQDGDLIPNEFDACPTQMGLRKNSPANPGPQDFCPSGCPELLDSNGDPIDSDGDDIFDCEDRCPNEPGIKYNHAWTKTAFDANGIDDLDADLAYHGCPDRDSDGIPDIFDACPDQAGGACSSGCPDKGDDYDSDLDGVPDCRDKCPGIYAVGTAYGCPDLDYDGIPDLYDYCLASPGSAVFSYDRKLEDGQPTKYLKIQGCPDSDGDFVPDPADLCDAPAYPDQGPTSPTSVDTRVDGVAVVDKTGCPLDSDNDGLFDGIDMCDGTVHSANALHDPQAIVFVTGDADATDDMLGCPKDSDYDGFADGLDQCPNEGGLVGPGGCPIDSDNDGVSDCVSVDPPATYTWPLSTTACHSTSAITDGSCCTVQQDTCPGTPRGAAVDSSGCTSDSDGDGVVDGLDMCPTTSQVEIDLGNSDPSLMTIDMKGCAIPTAPMWETTFVDITTTESNGANPGIELLFAVNANLPQVLESRQYNVATEMVEIRVMDSTCQNAFDDVTTSGPDLLPFTIKVNSKGAFSGQLPFDSLPITVDIDLNPDNVVGSPLWSINPPYDVGGIDFCLGFSLLSDTLEPVTTKELKASILVDMTQGFSVIDTAVQRSEAEETTKLIDIEYNLKACQCTADDTCVEDSGLDDSFLRQSESLKLCIRFGEDDNNELPPEYVQMVDIKTFSCSQGGLTTTPINNFERQDNGGQLTAVEKNIVTPGEGQSYGPNDRMLTINTRLPSSFFGVEERPVDCFGTLMYEFANGATIGDPVAGDRRRLSAKVPLSLPSPIGQRKVEAVGESQSEFSVSIMIAKASEDDKVNVGLIAGLTVAVVATVGVSMFLARNKQRRGRAIWLEKRVMVDDNSDRPARAAPDIPTTRRQTLPCTDDGSVSTFAVSTSGAPPPQSGWVA